MMTVRNMTSARSGREVANQFVIEDGATIVFQSYATPIASYNRVNCECIVNEDYFDYSVTTSKYFNQFIKEYVDYTVDTNELKKALKTRGAFGSRYVTFTAVSNEEFTRG